MGALVKQLVDNDAILVPASGAVQGDLEVLVVDGDSDARYSVSVNLSGVLHSPELR